jgi:hypothetical protein
MNALYILRFDLDNKRRKKSIWLPNKAKDVKCNKNPSLCGPKGYCVKIKYILKEKRKEKLSPISKKAKNISIWACRKTGRIRSARSAGYFY